jgi:ATP-dependent exoDNAse (exonuclease V) beta subunit
MERLLYVALTRAKHTLVLACDHELFAKASGEVHSASQIKWLQAGKGEQNESVFESISGGANACSQTAARQTENRQAEKIDKLPIAGKIDIEVARQNASMFARNLNPSGLPPEEISDTRPTDEIMRPAAASGPALRYGVWWHEFVQQLSWNAPPSVWDKIFAAGNESSPNRTRSLREWQMLREHLASESDFRRRIAAKIVYQEMPLFWKIDQSKCLEGIVDLALLAPNEEKVFILDWKTNRIAQDQLERLRAQYRPQMAAYWKAVTQLTKARVEAAIYSTSTGQLAIYENDELVTEWNRLLELPPEQLAVVVTNDEPRTSAQLEFANFS